MPGAQARGPRGQEHRSHGGAHRPVEIVGGHLDERYALDVAVRDVSSPGRSQPACSLASNSSSRSSESRTPRSISEATIPSRSSTDWKLETERSSVLPSRSCSVTVSSATRPGQPSNSNVCTMPSGDGVPWKTPWNPYSFPAASVETYRHLPPSRTSYWSTVMVRSRGPSHWASSSG